MTRLLVVTFVAVLAVFGGTLGAGAQIPPVDDVTDPIEETVEQVTDPIEETAEQVEGVVEQTVDDGEQTIEDTKESTEQTTEAVTGTADPISHTAGVKAGDEAGGAT